MTCSLASNAKLLLVCYTGDNALNVREQALISSGWFSSWVMQIIFVLDKDAHPEEIERGLHLISGISWGFVGNNLSIHVPENLLDSLEERILSAVARGVAPAPKRVSGTIEDSESSALCGALQAELLDRYLPIAIEKMTKDVVVTVDSIDDEHSMLRIRGPKELASEIDKISSWIMSKCAVGVHRTP